MTVQEKIVVDYDRESDVLYVDVGEPEPSYCEYAGSALVFLRKNKRTDEIAGLVVMDFSYVLSTGFFVNHKLPDPFSKDVIDKILIETGH